MAEVTGLYLLEGTPVWAIVMTFMWIGLYLTTGDQQHCQNLRDHSADYAGFPHSDPVERQHFDIKI